MIITRVQLNNIYSFNETNLDLSYERKLKNNTIEGEYLEERPNFKFKRVCIITGANASGKTAFGRVLCSIQNSLKQKDLPSELLAAINNKNEYASFIAEFATTDDLKLHRAYVTFNSVGIVKFTYINTKISKNASCQSTRKKLDKMFIEKKAMKGSKLLRYNREKDSESFIFRTIADFMDIQIFNSGWYYLIAENYISSTPMPMLTPELMQTILTTFDSNIKKVTAILGELNEQGELQFDGYNIKFKNGDSVLIARDGEIVNPARLSRGTYEAIKLSEFIAVVINDDGENTYYLDEGMAYSHSEIEQSVINLLIDKLSRYSQFFYTTHNYDILEMNLPIHSFVFFKKEENSIIISPEKDFKKNDRSLLNYVKNDIFKTLPNLDRLDDLLME